MLTCLLAHFGVASQTHLGRAGVMSPCAATEAVIQDGVAAEDVHTRRDDRDCPMSDGFKPKITARIVLIESGNCPLR
jgi:hypothetical protein